MSRLPYRRRKGARPFDDAGRLLCDRCGQPAQGWPIERSDNCGPGAGVSCLRQPHAVRASWQRFGYRLRDESPEEGANYHAGNIPVDAGGGRVADLRDPAGGPVVPAEEIAYPLGLVYLLHFTSPLKHARHYLGATGKTLEERTSAHRGEPWNGDSAGRPAKLVTALLQAGGDFVVARTWTTAKREEAFMLERQLKKRGSRARLCPICRPGIALLLALLAVTGCGGSPTAPTPTTTAPAVPACRIVQHPETRETQAVLVGGRLQFVTVVTPAWEERICS